MKPADRPSLRARARQGSWKAWLYLLPALLILGAFQVYPVLKSFLMGFYTRFDYLTDTVYEWGLDNFVNLFHDADFILAIRNTCVLVLVAAPLSILIALLFAVLLNSNIRLRKFFQSVYFLPFVTSMVAVSVVWAWMLCSSRCSSIPISACGSSFRASIFSPLSPLWWPSQWYGPGCSTRTSA